jgi:uncharacterized protein with HEPN domain
VTRTEEEILWEAFDSFELAVGYANRATAPDQLAIDAICMRIVAGVEALNKLTEERRVELFGESWANMRGIRNRVVHSYGYVDPRIILETARDDLPHVLSIITSENEN